MPAKTRKIESVLNRASEVGAFPGAVLCFRHGGETIYEIAAGIIESEGLNASQNTFYDLASLTKIYTVATALQILRVHQIPLDTPLNHFLPAFDSRITLRHLMQHSSGIQLHIQAIYESNCDSWLQQIAAAPIHTEPGTFVFYACTNAFLLGRVLIAIEGEKLEILFRRWILQPNNLKATFKTAVPQVVAPTELRADGSYLRGIVHDEAARSFREQTGDCAGNAGLFSTAHDVADFCDLWAPESDFFHSDDLREITNNPLPERSLYRGLGWQIGAKNHLSESCPSQMLSHLGFTGPLMAFDAASRTSLVLLCNRVYPTRNGPDRLPFFREIAALCFATFA